MTNPDLAIEHIPEEAPWQAARNWRSGLAVGLHYDFHARADDEDIGRGVDVDELVEIWRAVAPDWIQCDTKGHPGYASYPSEVGPRPAVLPGDLLRTYRDASRRLGLPLVSHYCSLLDELAAKRPEWARVDEHGRPSNAVCINSGHRDDFMIPQLLEVIDRYDIDGVWIDGDTWVAAPCYCDRCQALYRDATGAPSVPRSSGDPGWWEWLAFHRACYERHVRTVADAVHGRKPQCLVTVNLAYSLAQPEEVSLPVDSLSFDLAHNHTLDWQESEVRFLDGRGMPWDLQQWTFTYLGRAGDLEMRSRDHLCQAGAVTLASGGAAAYYLQPLRTGMPVRWQHEEMAAVLDFCRRRAPHCIGTESVPQVAVLHSADSHYGWTEQLGSSAEVGLYTSNLRTANVKGAVLSLLDLHHHVDVVTDRQLIENAGDYPLVVVPEPRALAAPTLEALREYAGSGGRVLLTGAEATELSPELTGLRPGGAIEDGARWIELDGRASGVPGPWRLAVPDTAETVRTLLRHQEPSTGAIPFAGISVNRVGRGLVATIPGPIFASLFTNRLQWRRAIVGLAVDTLSPELSARIEGPPSVHFTFRRRGEALYVNLVNTAADPPPGPRKLDIERVPEVGPITVRLRLERRPRVVRVEPEGECELEWIDGEAVITVPRLHIHSILAVQ